MYDCAYLVTVLWEVRDHDSGCFSEELDHGKLNEKILFELKDKTATIRLISGNPALVKAEALVVPYNSRFEVDRTIFAYYSLQPE